MLLQLNALLAAFRRLIQLSKLFQHFAQIAPCGGLRINGDRASIRLDGLFKRGNFVANNSKIKVVLVHLWMFFNGKFQQGERLPGISHLMNQHAKKKHGIAVIRVHRKNKSINFFGASQVAMLLSILRNQYGLAHMHFLRAQAFHGGQQNHWRVACGARSALGTLATIFSFAPAATGTRIISSNGAHCVKYLLL